MAEVVYGLKQPLPSLRSFKQSTNPIIIIMYMYMYIDVEASLLHRKELIQIQIMDHAPEQNLSVVSSFICSSFQHLGQDIIRQHSTGEA